MRPGTGSTDPALGAPGSLFIGDVGWITFEDLNVARVGGRNFGWPCYEGPAPNTLYQNAHPANHGCDSFGTPANPSPHTPPVITTHHLSGLLSNPLGTLGNSIIGGAFYTADRYPNAYWGGFFFSDYGQAWVQVARFDANDELISVTPFATQSEGAVDWVAHPITGDLHYVALLSGEVRRLRYVGPQPNRPPVAVAGATPRAGVKPLSVSFTSVGSSDPDLDPLTFTWLFGDGTGGSGAAPNHTYPFPGHYQAILTAEDGAGGEARDTVEIVSIASGEFPTTGIVDAFARSNGGLGGSWQGATTALAIDNQQVSSTGSSAALWSIAANVDQEAFVTVSAVGPGMLTDILLKSQGAAAAAPRIRVRHDATTAMILVSVWSATTGWVDRGSAISASLSPGQRFGARALGNGVVQVWRDSTLIGTVDLSDVAIALGGGQIGFGLTGSALGRIDDFGGGNAIIDPNQAPLVSITSPSAGTFFVAGDTLRLRGIATDAEEHPDSLAWTWSIDLLHNNHIHPSIFSSSSRTPETIAEDHDDGTGVALRVKLSVADHAGHISTQTALVHPEVDVTPGPVRVTPDTVGTSGFAEYRFALRNLGRMPAPRSRWRLSASGVTLAQGDTSVAATDSVIIQARTFAPLSAGLVALRVTLDTLGTVPEPDESNNALVRQLRVINGPTRDALGPAFLLGPTASPAATQAWLRWRTDEVSHASVRYGSTTALGDSTAFVADVLNHDQVLTGLALGTRYYFQLIARDTLGNATVSEVDSFSTQPSELEVEPMPRELSLSSAWPNPASGSVRFDVALPREGHAEFTIFDLAGREVWRSRSRWSAGVHMIRWDGRSAQGFAVAPGLYLARLRAEGSSRVRRFVLVR